MSQNELIDFKDALNEYFKLKNKFEHELEFIKKKIINNQILSKKEKRIEFLKIMPKCINCKRPSKKGTIFSTIYHNSDDKTESYRILKAFCGNLADPCNLNIEIIVGKTDNIEELINSVNEDIKEVKNEIIDDKNKLLFGLITTEEAINNFDSNKSYLTDLTTLYESYLDVLNNITNNKEKKENLNEALKLFYNHVIDIKKCIKNMNDTDNIQYAKDAVEIYHNILTPLLHQIRDLKYSQHLVYNDDDNKCRLIQNKISLTELNITSNNKVIQFDIGLKTNKNYKNYKNNKKVLIIESDENEDKFSIKIKEPEETDIKQDEPIVGEGLDGIDWHIQQYKDLWSKLPKKLKTEFKLNLDWMKNFMYKCLNDKKKPGFNGCRLTTPPNIIIPPSEIPNGQYDFGISIYNLAFNKLPKSVQKTYLTLYKENTNTKEKDYSMFENAINNLVEKEVDFGSGFF